MLARFSALIAITGFSLGLIVKLTFKIQIQGKNQHHLRRNKLQHGFDSDLREVIPHAADRPHNFTVSYLCNQFINGLNQAITLKNHFIRQYVSFRGFLIRTKPQLQCELSMTTN